MKKNTEKIEQKGRKIGQILGINIASTTLSEVLTGVEQNISSSIKLGSRDKQFSILTPNPELVLSSTQDLRLKEALNSADFSVPDGVGLAYAYKFLFGKSLNIIPGRKLFDELIKLAGKKGWKVFLLGGLNNEAELAAKQLTINNPQLAIETSKGPKLNKEGEPETEINIKLQKDAIDKINKFSPDLLFVAFGNPKQEIWIHKNLSKLNVRGAMAVGGTFRYVAGLSALPPKWMEKAGLEWVFRLVTEPFRLGRILNAVITFPLKVFQYKISHR